MKKKIKCSECSEEFNHGYEYRKHWEKHHLEYAIKFANELRKRNETL